jgi:hypothetical protein
MIDELMDWSTRRGDHVRLGKDMRVGVVGNFILSCDMKTLLNGKEGSQL